MPNQSGCFRMRCALECPLSRPVPVGRGTQSPFFPEPSVACNDSGTADDPSAATAEEGEQLTAPGDSTSSRARDFDELANLMDLAPSTARGYLRASITLPDGDLLRRHLPRQRAQAVPETPRWWLAPIKSFLRKP